MNQPMPELTVIGSYPVPIDTTQLMESYIQHHHPPSWHPFIFQAVTEMINAGVSLVSDGQTRDPFVTIFTRGFSGCQVRERTTVIEPIEFTHPVTLDDLQYVRSIIPENVRLLGLLVGPYTLSQSVIDQVYHDEKELAFAFAEALRQEAECIEPFVDLISVDEPFYANGFVDYADELLKHVLQNISIPTRLHACGDVTGIVSELLDLPVNILSHEFSATPDLFNVFSEHSLENKSICLGSVRSDIDRIESVEEIKKHLNQGKQVFGDHIVQISPDCGLRLLSPHTAFHKLKQLRLAIMEVYDE